MNEETKVTQIVEQMKNGYEKGFTDFYSQTYKYVYSRAKCMFSDEQEAADLTQEVYLAAYRNINSLKENESIFGWLRTITFYQGTKMLKKKRKELLLSEESEELFETIADEEEVENDYMEKQDIEIIRACINRLSEEQKAAILAYYYDNLKVDEIAKLMELSEGTVKSRLYLARKNLKGFIEEEEKKQGYKLHSFGPAALAFVLRSMLQENMELAGIREAGIFASVCQELNLTLGAGAKKGILGAIAGLGAKKIAISAAAVIGAIVIGGASIVALTKKDDKPEEAVTEKTEEIQAEETVEEDVVEVQQWQKDYAKILMELLYAPAAHENLIVYSYDSYRGNYNYEYIIDDIYSKEIWYSGIEEGTATYGLQDVNDDGIPELFVTLEEWGMGDIPLKFMFKTGNSMEKCYIGIVSYVDTEQNEIVFRGTSGDGAPPYEIYAYDGNTVTEKFCFNEELVLVENSMGDDFETIYVRYKSSDYENKEQITKEEYDTLVAQYSKAEEFPLTTCKLTRGNIESQFGVQILDKYISLYQHCNEVYEKYFSESKDFVWNEIYFNNDDEPDYVLSGYAFHVLFITGNDRYYVIDDLETGPSGYYTYIEKTGKLIYYVASSGGISRDREVYELNELYELDCIASVVVDCKRDMYNQPIINPDTDEYYFVYEYHIEGIDEELTEDEWKQKFDELLPGEELDLYSGEDDFSLSELFGKTDFIIPSANNASGSKTNKTLEKATHFTTASASSTLPDEGKYNYSPTNVLTKDASCWVEGVSGYGEGEWIKLELPKKQLLSGLEIINGYAAGTSKQYTHNSKITEVLIEFSNGESITATLEVFDDANKNTVQTVKFDKPVETSYVKITIKGAKPGEYQDTCLTYVAPF